MSKLALITGASSGIGRALAGKLNQEGYQLVLCGRDLSALQSLKDELGVHCQIIAADLLRSEDRSLVSDIIKNQKPNLIINSAGVGVYGPALSLSIQKQMDVITLNVYALQELTLVAAKMMKEHNIRGTIVNISSAAGYVTMPNFTVYSSSKAFVTHFSECLDFELKRYGIRVLASCPGVVETNFRERAGGKREKTNSMSMHVSVAVNEIWKQIRNGQRVRVFDWKYRVMIFLCRYILPTALTARYTQKQIREIQA